MPFKAKARSSFRYSVIIFVVLVLCLFGFFLYQRSVKVAALKENLARLVDLQEDYAKLDSCVYVLYQADNSSKLYEATASKDYLQKFSLQMQKASALLNDLDAALEDKGKKGSFPGLPREKKLKTENYLKVRKLTDSLILGFSKLGLIERSAQQPPTLVPGMGKEVKTIVHFDTIKKAAPKKKFFGRLGEAFSGKAHVKDSVIVVKRESKKVVSVPSRHFSKKQLKKLDNYYRELYAASGKLKKEEKDILAVNGKLLEEIISVLRRFKKEEIGAMLQERTLVGAELQQQVRSLNGISIFNGILLLSLIVVIVYHTFKLYKNEKLLLNLSKRSSQEVHSKSRFLANMSHELRTPLNSVIGFSEQLGKSPLNEGQSEQLRAIRKSSEMLLELVNEILDFSKYEVGKINFEYIPFIVEEEINEVFNSMNVLAANKNVTLINKVFLAKELCLGGDKLRLKQVVMNLLTNAIKFTSEGEVTLKVQFIQEEKRAGILKAQIEDTGIGIAREDLDYIFDEFSQVYSPSRTKQQGTGLGLAICKKIVELQGGKISVSSVPDKGSVFSFEIPYALDEMPEKLVVTDKRPGLSSILEGKRILLVDDNKMNILLAQTILKKWKMDYDSAFDGKEALDLFRKNSYDLVLTDIQMPVMGGVELTHEIRYNGGIEKSGIPILGVTAHVLQENRDAYLKVGMNDLVLKPFLEKELIDQIKKYI
ncbi:ATP-binding protein [Pedobacter nutrimenti]|uniref:histidine kinase n=1 Tax=Pedobacter nutrimenti TaxID=1241337 RepID=A0A318UDS6_9SPHI|nr:ATP-binding protein [Pedobacter nutrimenti]PYF74233.1 phospho-acceptor domain-containing protein [Pedobacter nutrimenti]